MKMFMRVSCSLPSPLLFAHGSNAMESSCKKVTLIDVENLQHFITSYKTDLNLFVSGHLLLEDDQQDPGQRQEEEKLRRKIKFAS